MSDWITKIFGDEENYQNFAAAMKQTEEEKELPAAINMENHESYTPQDLHQLMLRLKKDTGLALDANYYLDGEKLRLMLIVDLPLEDDTPRLRLVK